MNLTLFGVIALVAFVSDSSGQFQFCGPASFGGPGGFGGMFAPPAAANGFMMGQEASKNAVNFAVNSAVAKVDVTDLSPELQEELQQALSDSEYGLAACDEFLLSWNFWRAKVCKFQELAGLKLKIQEIKAKATAYAAASTEAPSTFQSGASA